MPVCTAKWRADISQFLSLTHPIRVINLLCRSFSKIQNILSFFFNLFWCLFLVATRWQCKSWPQKKAAVKHFSCCHWNVNSLAAKDYKTALLLEAYNAIHHYYLICVLETYLDSSVSNDEKDILVKGSKSNRIYSLSSCNKC